MKSLLGPSIQIDPSFPYYSNRSEQSIADELLAAGYRVVHYFVTDETKVNGKLVDRLHREGMTVWAMVLGNGAYTTAHLPKDWPDWQMQLLKPVHDGYYRLSPFSYRYTEWKKQAAADLVRTYPFDGFEIAEPYFPEWNGLSSGVYGDLGPYARAQFKLQYGSPIPEFRYSSSPHYYKSNPILYRQWIEFRVDAVNRFLFEIINGPGGVREARPDIRIATWSLGVDAGPDAVGKLREYQGIDAVSMVSTVRPDAHFVQTHWPDWMRWRLPADYAKRYEPFVARVRVLHPGLPLGLQTDIGSLKPMRRSRGWLERFAAVSGALGYATWTAYEHHLGKAMYTEQPQPVRAERHGEERVKIVFQKRVDPASASPPDRYEIVTGRKSSSRPLYPDHVKVDGSTVWLRSGQFPKEAFELSVSGIKDTPELWLFPEKRGNEMSAPYHIKVDGTDKNSSL
ncbi:poly-beta-1,6-N-acetyl-D-glucosamine N-deacetylase PgaB [Paenibacillus doosanensis]|uniref:poly-beta-1,6-N-acetyl-D-glucosamine N-deacetylase PgaB n=1 Tax=Paenibacillus doosanensis TaxID=1229154 RepID=UPI00217F7EAE|nr:poly-beta-1,6-N-acetyl-D-glucosamine N-deacetylase PgaB [Paenibacillus doosanensis]MCS7464695.1 poly-beta-1,6-N-acetyl-D-glucosamine N-deacetylase PgaB [Paenibacillus doosanensis]